MENEYEELSQEEEDDSPQEESSEEEEDNNTQEEETEEESSTPQYSKERFDGLMSSWQRDRQQLLELQKEVEKIKDSQKPAEKSKEDVWIDYLAKKIDEKNKSIEAGETAKAQRELDEVKMLYPDLDSKAILDRAIKYEITLNAAAKVLKDMKTNQEAGKTISQKDLLRKQTAGKIGGKPSATSAKGLTPYDKNLSLAENIEKGVKELGL